MATAGAVEAPPGGNTGQVQNRRSLARAPVFALFAAALGAGPQAIGIAVAISTITGIFFDANRSERSSYLDS